MAEAGDAFFVAERLLDRIAESDRRVFNRVVKIDVQIAFGFESNVDQRMMRKLLNHVIEKSDAG